LDLKERTCIIHVRNESIRYNHNTCREGELVSAFIVLCFVIPVFEKEIYRVKTVSLFFSVLLLSFTNNRSGSESNI